MSGRLVVVESIYYQENGRQPSQIEANCSTQLKTDEQPYGPRYLKVDTEWTPISLGCWLKESSLLVIQHETPNYYIVPEREQRGIDEQTVLVIGVGFDPLNPVQIAALHQGQSIRIPNPELSLIHARSNYTTKVVVTVYPK